MLFRRVGHTDLQLSVVGFGTCQLRMVPERQAIQTLCKGFELGVNWVHASPDYEGAEELVARAIAESGRRDIIPVTNGWASADKLLELFANSCRIHGRDTLPLYGLSCIDDDELLLRNNVWGPGGLVAQLQQLKRDGRIQATFCSTHAPPEYVQKLIESGAFDAIMLAYNPLGFHALSYDSRTEGKPYEVLPENARRIFPLAAERGVSLLVMKPFAGGMLTRGKAFPGRRRFSHEQVELAAPDILRVILQHPGVTAVVAGTAAVAEAEQNARAGHAPLEVAPAAQALLEQTVTQMRKDLCSRCGECDTTCSQSLPISWLFREGYMWSYQADTFEGIDRHHYFRLHPGRTLACATCTNQTCHCPHGIGIPRALGAVHAQVLELSARQLMHSDPAEAERFTRRGHVAARVLTEEAPDRLTSGKSGLARFWLENVGDRCWTRGETRGDHWRIFLRATTDRVPLADCELRHDVHPGERAHFAFDLPAPRASGDHRLYFELVTPGLVGGSELVTRIAERTLQVVPAARSDPGPARAPASEYAMAFVAHSVPAHAHPGEVVLVRMTLENRSARVWHTETPTGKCIDLVVSCAGAVLDTWKLGRPEVQPGEQVEVIAPLALPAVPGRHVLCFDLVEQTVARFSAHGIRPLEVPIEIVAGAPTADAALFAHAQRVHPWHYLATQGVAAARDQSSFPVFVARARGCRIWDQVGKEYIDYTMGWGSTVLGYAHPAVTAAVQEALAEGTLLAYPRPLQAQVEALLLADFPGAGMVAFGKNGSDVCTLAARLCRAFTRRQTLLHCGYHGWGDTWVEPLGFAATGVPEPARPLLHRFRFNDIDGFLRLFAAHERDLAGVFLEPSGPWGGHGCEPDADQEFLEVLRDKTREVGALLVFDEIVTGYRYPQGSVQRARGVVPDLTCLGKAMASGLPLAALLGRSDILRSAYDRTRYGPTFQEETLGLAAAKATIEWFHAHPVATQIWEHGTQLRAGIETALAAAGVPGRVTGPPFRMSLVLGETDPRQLLLQRTLLQQELLRRGVSIFNNGVMLPCAAHDAATLAQTHAAFAQSLEIVAAAARAGSLSAALEIPPLRAM